jgi:hypothetical protein
MAAYILVSSGAGLTSFLPLIPTTYPDGYATPSLDNATTVPCSGLLVQRDVLFTYGTSRDPGWRLRTNTFFDPRIPAPHHFDPRTGLASRRT